MIECNVYWIVFFVAASAMIPFLLTWSFNKGKAIGLKIKGKEKENVRSDSGGSVFFDNEYNLLKKCNGKNGDCKYFYAPVSVHGLQLSGTCIHRFRDTEYCKLVDHEEWSLHHGKRG